MSDFNNDPQVPPPPAGVTPPPPPAAGYAPPPGYGAYPQVAQKPPRPAVPVGCYLLIAGGLLMILGSVLKWYVSDGQDFNGFSKGFDPDTFKETTNDGPVFVTLAVLSIGFGIAQLAAKRVLAVAIIAVVLGALGMFAALADIGQMGDLEDQSKLFGVQFESGSGLYVVLLGSLVGLAGGIVTLAKRRR